MSLRGIRKGHTPVPVHPEWARDCYMFGKSDDGPPLEGMNLNAEDMLSLWEAPMVACEVTTHPKSVLRLWFVSNPTCQLYHLLREASASLIVKVAAVKCGLVNVKMCEEKTRGLMREMQAFELPPTLDIKATLPAFKHTSKSFAEWAAELTKFLGYESPSSSPILPIPVRSPSYVTSKQADIIRSGIEDALPALREEAEVAETAAITRHGARLRAALTDLPDDPFLGPHNLLSLAPAVRSAEVQNALGARFCAANYREQFVIMRGILLGEMARYETMAFECWGRVDDIKDQIKQLEVIETKKERMREVLLQSRAEIPALEAKVFASQKRTMPGFDRTSALSPTPAPEQLGATTISSAEAARAKHRAERAEASLTGGASGGASGVGGGASNRAGGGANDGAGGSGASGVADSVASGGASGGASSSKGPKDESIPSRSQPGAYKS